MKIYGETIFDIAYLLFAIISGIYILIKSKDKKQKLIGSAILILGLGDSFHLIPRVLNYFIDKDFNLYLGVGKLVTSITMTIFYLLMYYVYKNDKDVNANGIVYFLFITRIILCLLPQNNWLTNNSSIIIGIIRNIPFLLLGILIIILYHKDKKNYGFIWLYVFFSFLFYVPVVLFAGFNPIFGMLMLPKTICYILIIIKFIKITKK